MLNFRSTLQIGNYFMSKTFHYMKENVQPMEIPFKLSPKVKPALLSDYFTCFGHIFTAKRTASGCITKTFGKTKKNWTIEK